MVLKMFTLFEVQSMGLLYILGCAFEELWVTKPATSKAGNSEVYVIGKGYKPLSSAFLQRLLSCVAVRFPRDDGTDAELALLAVEHMPGEFLAEMTACAKMFSGFFIAVIERNLDLDANGKVPSRSL